MSTSFLLFSRFGTDHTFESHWKYSTPVLTRRKNWWRFWNASFYQPILNDSERECVEAWLTTLALQLPPLASRELSPRVMTQDSLAIFESLYELRDGVNVLQNCLHSVVPYLQEVRRETQEKVVFLHCKVVSDVVLRVPLTSYTFVAWKFPSVTTLQLEPSVNVRGREVVTAVEHRWFGGPIWSQQTSSVRSPWGDIGDLGRRYNGFMLSLMLTSRINVKERFEKVRTRAKRIEETLRLQQEEQLNSM